MTKPSVVVENVSKKFGQSLESALKYGIIDTLRRCTGLGKDEKVRKGEFWALNDVSFSLAPGDALGIMGVNGSGKTTLLRILNGTYAPDSGKVTLRGRVGALIAAGAGFSPMLTGRENVFISGALLGMSSREVRRRFDEIVAFSELEEFIDMPVRNYSSGMAVRLGFAVAVLGAPDILLVDEVLAVGDISFQKKCFERIHAMRSNGTTILLVTHSIGAMWATCNCGLFLNKGKSSGIMSAEDACRLYSDMNYKIAISSVEIPPDTPPATSQIPSKYGSAIGGTGDALVTRFEIIDKNENPTESIEFQGAILLRMHIRVVNTIKNALFRYSIDAVHYKYIFDIDSSYSDGVGMPDVSPGEYLVTTSIPQQSLRPGAYTVNLAICQKDIGVHVYFKSNAGKFTIKHPKDRFLLDTESPAIVHFDACFTLTRNPDAPNS